MSLKRLFDFALIFFTVTLFLLIPKWAFAQNLSVGNYSLVFSQRVSRYEYDYTYRADINNKTGPAVQNVTASLTSNSTYTTVIEGDLTFGDVITGETVVSSDTFKIRVNRRYPFSEDDLLWNVSFQEPTPEVTRQRSSSSLDNQDIEKFVLDVSSSEKESMNKKLQEFSNEELNVLSNAIKNSVIVEQSDKKIKLEYTFDLADGTKKTVNCWMILENGIWKIFGL